MMIEITQKLCVKMTIVKQNFDHLHCG